MRVDRAGFPYPWGAAVSRGKVDSRMKEQLTGVNVLLLYVLDILASAGIGLFVGHTYTILISCPGAGNDSAR
jgi:hypothetical protein